MSNLVLATYITLSDVRRLPPTVGRFRVPGFGGRRQPGLAFSGGEGARKRAPDTCIPGALQRECEAGPFLARVQEDRRKLSNRPRRVQPQGGRREERSSDPPLNPHRYLGVKGGSERDGLFHPAPRGLGALGLAGQRDQAEEQKACRQDVGTLFASAGTTGGDWPDGGRGRRWLGGCGGSPGGAGEGAGGGGLGGREGVAGGSWRPPLGPHPKGRSVRTRVGPHQSPRTGGPGPEGARRPQTGAGRPANEAARASRDADGRPGRARPQGPAAGPQRPRDRGSQASAGA